MRFVYGTYFRNHTLIVKAESLCNTHILAHNKTRTQMICSSKPKIYLLITHETINKKALNSKKTRDHITSHVRNKYHVKV